MWLDHLEKRFGKFAIPGLIRIVVGFNALVFVLQIINPYFIDLIDLDPQKVMQGEVWRLVSYIFIPRIQPGAAFSLLLVLIALWILWIMGEGLEEAWGSFKLNAFYFCGMFGVTVAAFFFGGGASNLYLNLSIFFAFATLYPNHVFYLFLILPVKVKWLAWLAVAFVVVLPLAGGTWAMRLAIVASLGNYLLFFGPDLLRNWREQQKIMERRRKFEREAEGEAATLHRCTTCGRTEDSDPELDFRVASDGEEYCVDHLPNRQAATDE